MPAERQISSRSDFIIEDDLFHTEGVDLTEKSTSCEVLFSGGDKGIRTPGLRIANATLYQLSHTPTNGTIGIIAYSEPDCKYVFGFDLKKLAGVKTGAGGTIAMNPKRR